MEDTEAALHGHDLRYFSLWETKSPAGRSLRLGSAVGLAAGAPPFPHLETDSAHSVRERIYFLECIISFVE